LAQERIHGPAKEEKESQFEILSAVRRRKDNGIQTSYDTRRKLRREGRLTDPSWNKRKVNADGILLEVDFVK